MRPPAVEWRVSEVLPPYTPLRVDWPVMIEAAALAVGANAPVQPRKDIFELLSFHIGWTLSNAQRQSNFSLTHKVLLYV